MIWAIITLLIIIADQVAKYFVASYIDIGEILFSVFGLFDISHVLNSGGAFSILSGKTIFLALISALFCVAVVLFWVKKKPTHTLLCTALTLVFAGAFSNGIDRLFRGYVVDYIQTTFINFPVFNIADIAITVGAVLMVAYCIWCDNGDKNGKTDN